MSLTRRAFLRATAITAAAGLVLDPERLLWVPGAKVWFLPPERPILLGLSNYYMPVEVVDGRVLREIYHPSELGERWTRAVAESSLGDLITIPGVHPVNPSTNIVMVRLPHWFINGQ